MMASGCLCGRGHGLAVSIAYLGPGGDRGTCDVCMRSVVEGEVVWACHPCKWWTCNECRSAPRLGSSLPPVPRADAGEVAQFHFRTTALCVARLLEAAEGRLQRVHRRLLRRRLRRRQRKSGKRESKLASALLVAIISTGWAARAHARAARQAAAAAEAAAVAEAEAAAEAE